MIIVNEIRYLAKGDEWGSDGDIRTMAFGQQIGLGPKKWTELMS